MVEKEHILKIGREVYLKKENTQKMIYSNHKFADETSDSLPAYILAEERFISGHDDTARFVEMIDTNDRILRRWMFHHPMDKRFEDPALCDDDCLILYLKETFGLPVKRGWGYTGYPSIIKVEELY